MPILDLESVLAQITSSSTHPAIMNIVRDAAGSEILPTLAFDRWLDLSVPEYLQILPALRLATQILFSPRALQFFHARLFGRTGTMQDSRGVNQPRFGRKNRHDDAALSPQETAKVTRYLNDLMVTLRFGDLESAHGLCEPQPHECIHPRRAGVRSIITVSLTHLYQLDLIYESGPTILKRWTTIAITLCHELCHAINAALDGLASEPFFEDDSFSELGHAFEKFVLGGFLQADKGPGGELFLLMGVWSAEHIAEQHAQCGIYVPTTDRAADTDSGTCIVVDDAWTERLFNREFWGIKVPSDGGQALRIPLEWQADAPTARDSYQVPAQGDDGDARLKYLWELLMRAR
jgi:hypothetical protein